MILSVTLHQLQAPHQVYISLQGTQVVIWAYLQIMLG